MGRMPDGAAPRGDANPFTPPAARPARPARVVAVGPVAWGACLAVTLGSGWICAICWSLGMSLVPGQEFGRVVAGSGAVFGGFMGLVFGGQFAFLLRPARAALPAPDGADLLARVDVAVHALRYRLLEQGPATRRYGARTLIRPRSTEINVRVVDDHATFTGPMANLKALIQRLNR